MTTAGNTATLDRRAGEDYAESAPAPAMPARTVVGVGLRAGVAAGAVMIAWEMTAAEIAREPTVVAGIVSSTWTPVTGIASFLLGVDALSASLAPGAIVLGLLVHFAMSAVLGVAGTAALVWVLGYRPGPVGAALCGFAYGLFLEVVVMNIVVTSIQDPDVVYRAAPEWTWWVAHGAYGIGLGLVGALMLQRRGEGGFSFQSTTA